MEKQKFQTYKGYPLVRKGTEIYYGNMYDDYVAKIDIKGAKKIKDLEVADDIRVQLLPTDVSKPLDLDKMKSANRNSLYEVLEIANTWLIKANEE
ncbi:MAG: hypothetical protein FWD34_04805 [Oscillospiraceae bacterium]|nr:hypothetical protein [Oscillospiraceae bacterium]